MDNSVITYALQYANTGDPTSRGLASYYYCGERNVKNFALTQVTKILFNAYVKNSISDYGNAVVLIEETFLGTIGLSIAVEINNKFNQ